MMNDDDALNLLTANDEHDEHDEDDDKDEEDEDEEVEDDNNRIHKCKACQNKFKPFIAWMGERYLRVSNCPNFDGNLQIEEIQWLIIEDYNHFDLSTLKLPSGLEKLELRNIPNATNADKLVLPFSVERLKIENVPNARNLKIPLSIDDYSFVVSSTDSEDGKEAKETIYNPTDVLINATDYYNSIHLIIEPYTVTSKVRSCNCSTDEIAQHAFNFYMNYLNLHEKSKWSIIFKRKCTNLNWLMSNLHGWDWNLNVIIDNYCGFFINRNE